MRRRAEAGAARPGRRGGWLAPLVGLLVLALATVSCAALHDGLARSLARGDVLAELLTSGAVTKVAAALALFALRALLLFAAPAVLAALAAWALVGALVRPPPSRH